MPRPTWKGYLKLSLVSCPVALYPATTSRERVSFHIMNRETGNRTRYLVVDGETQEPVEPEDRVRGYEISKNSYVYVEDDEIEAVKIDSTHTIDIDNFVPRKEVDELYLNAPYYLAPEDKVGEEAFLVIREAMRQKQVVGIGRIVMSRRERMLLIEPRGKGLLATTLRNANEVRSETAYFEGIPEVDLPEEMLSIAADIVARKSARFDPRKFEDRYEKALMELIEAKGAGKPAPAPAAPRPHPTANLMDALRRSLEREPAGAQAPPRGRRTAAKGATAASRRRGNGKAGARRAS
ncbi:MAG: Ku protein [Hyphomicrobiaceae bacterium]|nr:Ku protein [Hyphomicrobiaceae bacterium]